MAWQRSMMNAEGEKGGGREGGRESMLGKEALQAPSRRSKEDKKKPSNPTGEPN